MIIRHHKKIPKIAESAYIASTATICGDVHIGENTIVLHGAAIVAESGTITIGSNCVILENAVIRSSENHHTHIGNTVLIGPHAHLVGCIVEDDVFIATGASIFHGAKVGTRSEVRIHGIVHIKTVLDPDTTVPISWVAVDDPARMFPPDKHDEIWEVQKSLNFPFHVYGVERPEKGHSNMDQITQKYRSIFLKK